MTYFRNLTAYTWPHWQIFPQRPRTNTYKCEDFMFLHHLPIKPRQGFRRWLTVDSEDTYFLTTFHTSEIPEANKLDS